MSDDLNQAGLPARPVGSWRNGPDWKSALLPVPAIMNHNFITPFFRESYT